MAHDQFHNGHHSALGNMNFSSSANMAMRRFEPSNEMFNVQLGVDHEMLGITFPRAGSSSNYSDFPPRFSENLMVTPESLTMNAWPPPLANRMSPFDESPLTINMFSSEGAKVQPTKGLSLSLPELQDGQLFQSPTSQTKAPTISLFEQTMTLKGSKYLSPAQELLKEFCNLQEEVGKSSNQKLNKLKRSDEGESSSSYSSSSNQILLSLDISELHKRKAKLLSMAEELNRRYRRYCEQMRVVISSFEAVAGEGAAVVYAALASKVMSRHFRRLRDSIAAQIRATKKAMGEKDPVALGTARGETTPRLRIIVQYIRQQKSFQQAVTMEAHPWRPPQRGLPERSVSVLRAWLFEHFLHPYPSDVDKRILARQTGLSRSQVTNWFINARVRLWKPMVEEMYLEEVKEQGDQFNLHENNTKNKRASELLFNENPSTLPYSSSELETNNQKPVTGQLFLADSAPLSSIFNSNLIHHSAGRAHMITTNKPIHPDQNQNQLVLGTESFGEIDLDFASYNHCSNDQKLRTSVPLTLGLQQDNASSMSLSFSPPATHNSLLFSREPRLMEECHPSQFSTVGGAHLLRDSAG